MAELVSKYNNIKRLIGNNISKKNDNWVFMFEIPEEDYFTVNIQTVKTLIDMKLSCIYISVHRPYSSLVEQLKNNDVNLDRLAFIDAASSAAEIKNAENARCKYVSKDLEVNELIRAIYQTSAEIKEGKKFIFLDSLTTLTLYQPLSETLRFGEFLTRTLRNSEFNGVIINVAKGLSQKKFIQDIMLHVDKTIKIGDSDA